MTLEITPPISIAKAYSPSHITGFYSEVKNDSALNRCSLGAGVSIRKGVKTTVELYDSERSNFTIRINGVDTKDAIVSKFVIDEFLKRAKKHYFLNMNNEVQVQLGYRIGTSGSA